MWKTDVKSHLIEPGVAQKGIDLDLFSNGYAYVATLWETDESDPIIVLKNITEQEYLAILYV